MAPRASGFCSRQHRSLKILLNDAALESHACDACLGSQGAWRGGGRVTDPLKLGSDTVSFHFDVTTLHQIHGHRQQCFI